jgi:uncharacterized protein (DUF305 family)
MKTLSLPLAASFALVALILGIIIGYSATPEYRQTMFTSSRMDLGPADRWIDERYIDAMIAHHRGAMLLAEQAQAGGNKAEIKNLATDILAGEPKLIAELYNWKKDWYDNERTVRDPIVARLGSADATFDLRFLNALIAHHEAGIAMTQEVRMKSSRSEILNNADAVEQFLSGGITMLKEWRANWYNVR